MPADFKDYVQLPAVGVAITPTIEITPGVLGTATASSQGLVAVTAFSTASGAGAGPAGFAQVIGVEQALAVVGPVYNSPGNYRGNAHNQSGTVATGGGP